MPVDRDPIPDGNLAIVYSDPRTDMKVVRYLSKDDPSPTLDSDRYVSHFATCPDAKSFRRSE